MISKTIQTFLDVKWNGISISNITRELRLSKHLRRNRPNHWNLCWAAACMGMFELRPREISRIEFLFYEQTIESETIFSVSDAYHIRWKSKSSHVYWSGRIKSRYLATRSENGERSRSIPEPPNLNSTTSLLVVAVVNIYITAHQITYEDLNSYVLRTSRICVCLPRTHLVSMMMSLSRFDFASMRRRRPTRHTSCILECWMFSLTMHAVYAARDRFSVSYFDSGRTNWVNGLTDLFTMNDIYSRWTIL